MSRSRHLRVQAQVLNNDVLKSLVARARRRVGLHNNDCANLPVGKGSGLGLRQVYGFAQQWWYSPD
jgi:hypothetical protein